MGEGGRQLATRFGNMNKNEANTNPDPIRIGNDIFFNETENAFAIMTLIDPEPRNQKVETREKIKLNIYASRN